MDTIPAGLTPVIRTGLKATLSLPGPVLAKMTDELPEGADLLTPDQRFLASFLGKAGAESVEGVSIELQREQTDGSAAIVAARPVTAGLTVTEHEVEGAEVPLRMRLYRPEGAGGANGALLVWFHGGGWVVGSIASHDNSLRRLAAESGVAIASVDYRLAPEHPWPAAPDDCLAAWRDIRARAAEFGADPERMMVGGDSAGGNLAAVLCLELNWADDSMPLAAILIYPVTDLAGRTASYHQFSTGFFLSEEKMDFYRDCYLPGGSDRSDPRVSPLRAKLLRGLPPTYVATAAADPLRDEGEAFAARLGEEGVEVELERFPAIHGWFNMTVSPTSRDSLGAVAAKVAALSARPAAAL
ncbi:MAG: alpha/beta hydrolase [Solirubrobacterales bacterium]